jgi:hypothetical protein
VDRRSGRHTAAVDEDPTAQALRDHRRAVRELGEQAHGVNLDLGAGLLTGLSVIDAAQDMDVAWFFVLCGYPHRTTYADAAAMPSRSGCDVCWLDFLACCPALLSA